MSPRKKLKPIRNPSAEEAHSHQSQDNGNYHGPITRSRVLRHTIYSLPLDVLREILILALPTDLDFLQSPLSEARRFTDPLVLCAVCSSWRLLAYSTPQLWQRVTIHFPLDINEAQDKRKAAKLVQWIERSHSSPLTLHISQDISYLTGETDSIVSVLGDYAARWEVLHVQSCPCPPFLASDGWCSLRRLYLRARNYPYHDGSNIYNIAPWGQLTNLQIRHPIAGYEATIVMGKCPRLVHLSLLVQPPISAVPVILHDLITFSLSTATESYTYSAYMFLDQLSFPSLRELLLDAFAARDVPSLRNFFTRSSCTLDKLEIRGSCPTRQECCEILAHQSCRSLTLLSMCPIRPGVADVSVHENLLQRLTLHQNDTLCPQLKSLTINHCLSINLHSALLNMVESRTQFRDGQVPTLEHLQFHIKSSKNNMAELDKVGRKSGMEYSRQKCRPGCSSVWFRRRGSEALPCVDELYGFICS